MNTHFCGGQAVETSFSIGLHNPDCGMDNMDEYCEVNSSTERQFRSKPCCENQHQVLQLNENADLQLTSVSINHDFFIAFVYSFIQQLDLAIQTLDQYSEHSPPLPDQDIQVLFQAFLI